MERGRVAPFFAPSRDSWLEVHFRGDQYSEAKSPRRLERRLSGAQDETNNVTMEPVLGRLVGFFTRNGNAEREHVLTGPSPIHRGFVEEAGEHHRATRPMSSGKCAKYPIEVVTHPTLLQIMKMARKNRLRLQGSSRSICCACRTFSGIWQVPDF